MEPPFTKSCYNKQENRAKYRQRQIRVTIFIVLARRFLLHRIALCDCCLLLVHAKINEDGCTVKWIVLLYLQPGNIWGCIRHKGTLLHREWVIVVHASVRTIVINRFICTIDLAIENALTLILCPGRFNSFDRSKKENIVKNRPRGEPNWIPTIHMLRITNTLTVRHGFSVIGNICVSGRLLMVLYIYVTVCVRSPHTYTQMYRIACMPCTVQHINTHTFVWSRCVGTPLPSTTTAAAAINIQHQF